MKRPRANVDVTLRALRNAKTDQAAQDILHRALYRTWESGYDAGWADGVYDATENNGGWPQARPNPYGETQ